MKNVFLLSLLVSGCVMSPVSPQPAQEETSCERACERLRELGCDMGAPDEAGNSCETVCEETQKAGLINLKPEEIAASDSCP